MEGSCATFMFIFSASAFFSSTIFCSAKNLKIDTRSQGEKNICQEPVLPQLYPLVRVADAGVLDQRPKHHEEADKEVDVDGLHVGDLWQGSIDRVDQGGHGQDGGDPQTNLQIRNSHSLSLSSSQIFVSFVRSSLRNHAPLQVNLQPQISFSLSPTPQCHNNRYNALCSA